MKELIGQNFGRYCVVAKLGEGGMGVVYRARDEVLDREVAIKVLPEDVAQDPERLARFEREAKLLASLSHQYVATLHGLEEQEGRRFLVMEFAEGETLAARIARGPIPADFSGSPELYFDHEVRIEPRAFSPASELVLFESDEFWSDPWRTTYDMDSDGQRFLMVINHVPNEETLERINTHVNLIFNWFEELERMAPGD